MSSPVVKRFWPKIVFKSTFGAKFQHFLGKMGLNVNFNYFDSQRFELCLIPRVFGILCVKIRSQGEGKKVYVCL